MYIRKIGRFLLNKYPLREQEKWDFSGWLFRVFTKRTLKVVVALDINKKSIEDAINSGAKLIVTHHPHIFSSFKEHIQNEYLRDMFRLLKENGIVVLSLHTNYDNSSVGMAPNVASKLKYKTECEKSHINFTTSKPLKDLAIDIKDSYKLNNVTVYKNNKDEQLNVCFVPGGAGSMIGYLNEEINTFVTGDLKWHNLKVAKELNINVVDVSHGIEKLFIKHIAQIIKTEFSSLEVIESFSDSQAISI